MLFTGGAKVNTQLEHKDLRRSFALQLFACTNDFRCQAFMAWIQKKKKKERNSRMQYERLLRETYCIIQLPIPSHFWSWPAPPTHHPLPQNSLTHLPTGFILTNPGPTCYHPYKTYKKCLKALPSPTPGQRLGPKLEKPCLGTQAPGGGLNFH
jgi:hypothetical protein